MTWPKTHAPEKAFDSFQGLEEVQAAAFVHPPHKKMGKKQENEREAAIGCNW